MRQILDRLQPKETRAAFEGVKCTKDHVQGVCAGGIFLQYQNTLFNVLQQVFAFIAELVEELGIVAQFQRHGWLWRIRLCIRRSQPVLAGFIKAFVPLEQHLLRIGCKHTARSSHGLSKFGGSRNLRGNCRR